MSGLRLEEISRRFGEVQALDAASLHVERGAVHALLGENGAGKTTLVRIASGELRPDHGRIEIDGRAAHLASPAAAMRAGIGMVHQHFALVPALTVAENVALGGRGRYDRRVMAARVRELGERTGLVVDPDSKVDELPVAARQRVEILKALSRDSGILILDEPTAVLTPAETAGLLGWLRSFAHEGGTVVLITHKLREALDIADAITVLRHGRTVLADARRGVDERTVASAMLGETIESISSATLATAAGVVTSDTVATRATGEDGTPDFGRSVVVELDQVSATVAGSGRLKATSLRIYAGEVVSVAGVEGSGERELLRILAGRLAPASGRIRPATSVGFIPEDRHREALILPFTLFENVGLSGAGARRGWMRWRAVRDRSRRIMSDHDVRTGGVDERAATLSGGNQQKLVVGRELAERPALVVAENPTRGLDIRATERVHAALREAARGGSAVVIYSSDLDEVVSFGDRVLVAHAGSITETMRDRAAIGRAMLGVA